MLGTGTKLKQTLYWYCITPYIHMDTAFMAHLMF